MKKLLIVYNICGINENENVEYYIKAINSILDQTIDNVDVVISGCMVTQSTKDILLSIYSQRVYFNFIEEVLPVNVTFNHSVITIPKYSRDTYEGYLYMDSGLCLEDRNAIQNLYNVYKSGGGSYGMVSARTTTDTGAELWFGKSDRALFNSETFIIPVGKAINLHMQIFSKEIVDYYGKPFVDIFAAYCSESVFSFVCAAIKQKWVLCRDIVISHWHGMDGGSSGFCPRKWEGAGGSHIEHPFLVPSVLCAVQNGYEYGLGYEECQNILVHDPSHYDENGFCTNDTLKEYIKNNLYVPTGLLDYNTIKHTIVEAKCITG